MCMEVGISFSSSFVGLASFATPILGGFGGNTTTTRAIRIREARFDVNLAKRIIVRHDWGGRPTTDDEFKKKTHLW